MLKTPKDNFHGKTKRLFLNNQTINPHLICTVCLDVFEEPHRLLCGHTFCWICIQLCIKIKYKYQCPECRTDFSKRKPEKDLLASKLVDDLPVKCIHTGCTWMGINSVLRKHQRSCKLKEKKDYKDFETDNTVVVLDENMEQQLVEVNQKQFNTHLSKFNDSSSYEQQSKVEEIL